ncbi:MAG: diguanylate cyclase, partial [Syntrophomonadaceae bacterium]|nr:diguanylate cyclase [Syntrophomonadaceae bacterium]
MSLRTKTMTIIGVLLVSMMVTTVIAGQAIYLRSSIRQERQRIEADMQRVVNYLAADLQALETTTWFDWASWDETYRYASDGNRDYERIHLNETIFGGTGASLVLVTDAQGAVRYAAARAPDGGIAPAAEADVRALTSAFSAASDRGARASGLLRLSGGTVLAAGAPILTSTGEGPVNGTFILARPLDRGWLERLRRVLGSDMQLEVAESAGQRAQDGALPLSGLDAPAVRTQETGPSWVEARVLLAGVDGRPAVSLSLREPRTLYQDGLKAVRAAETAAAVIGILFSAAVLWLLQRRVVQRIERLNLDLDAIAASGDVSSRVAALGDDELGRVSHSVNRALKALEQSRERLRASEERYRTLTQAARDVIYTADDRGVVTFINSYGAERIGLPESEIIGRSWRDFFPPDIADQVDAQLAELLRSGRPVTAEIRVELARGTVWLHSSMVPMLDPQGQVQGVMGVARDISELKQVQQHLHDLSMFDALTGLYNRTFFEEKMEELDASRPSQAGVIVCDVDGLKLVNDSFGHEVGDILLVQAAAIIRQCFREGDIVARIGGDEFCVLLPDAPPQAVREASARIRAAVAEHNQDNPVLPVSVSVGWAAAAGQETSMAALFKEADDAMYREKLQSKRSARSAMVKVLMRAIEAGDFVGQGHLQRLQELVEMLGSGLGLSEQRLDWLRLLAQFHDIGKVSVPEEILDKPAKLTPNEFNLIKQHTYYTYCLLKLAGDLSPVKEWAAFHHEKLDGTGYPFRKKAWELDLGARLVAVA